MALLALAAALTFSSAVAICALGVICLRGSDARRAWLGSGLLLLGALVAALTWWNNAAPRNDPPFATALEAALGPAASSAFLLAALWPRHGPTGFGEGIVPALAAVGLAGIAALWMPHSWSLAHRTAFAAAALVFAARARSREDRWVALGFVSYATWDSLRLLSVIVMPAGGELSLLRAVTVTSPLRAVILLALPLALAGLVMLARTRRPRWPVVGILVLAMASALVARLAPQSPRFDVLLLITGMWRIAFALLLARGVLLSRARTSAPGSSLSTSIEVDRT